MSIREQYSMSWTGWVITFIASVAANAAVRSLLEYSLHMSPWVSVPAGLVTVFLLITFIRASGWFRPKPAEKEACK